MSEVQAAPGAPPPITEAMPERGATVDLPLQTRAEARVMPETADADARTVEVVWSTGATVRRRDLLTGRAYDEVLSLEPQHVDLARLNAGAPLLNTHGAFDVTGVLGVVERAWIAQADGRLEGRAIVRFSAREAVEPVWRDVRAGILRNVSVGYLVRVYEVTERDSQPPLWRAVDWQPAELSAVAVPADPGAGFRSGAHTTPCQPIHPAHAQAKETVMAEATTAAPQAATTDQRAEVRASDAAAESRAVEPSAKPNGAARTEQPVAQEETRSMPHAQPEISRPSPAEQQVEASAAATPQPAESPEAIAERVLARERERVAGIYDAARKLALDSAIADDLVRRGVALDAARGQLIDQAAGRDQCIETRPHIRTGALDESETRHSAVEAALLHRFDPTRYPLTDPARDWRGYSLVEMARSFLDAEGVRVRGLSRDEIATRALHTTSDFPHILAAVTNKTLRDAYEAAPRTFQPIARRVTAADFKDIHRLQLGEAPQLEKVGEAGEFKRGSIGEAKESYRVETYGKVVAITRQVIVNDDLDAFTRVPSLFGTAAATLESEVVWGIVTSNPAMADGVALFHATHKNLAGSGAELAVASLGKARAQMARQTGLDGRTILNVRPTFLVVPSSLELTAEQLLANALVPAKSGDVVPASIRSLNVIAEPRLDPTVGAVPWYLFASPAAIDTIEYAYLEGQDGVYIETRIGFDVDGVEVKARLDFGAKAIEWRGLYKNPGVTLS